LFVAAHGELAIPVGFCVALPGAVQVPSRLDRLVVGLGFASVLEEMWLFA
jgi:hypothetical protein